VIEKRRDQAEVGSVCHVPHHTKGV
jgi:hypothetical protein